MDGRILTRIAADVLHNHLLWRSVVFMGLLGLAFTQTTVPNMTIPTILSQEPGPNTESHETVEPQSNATSIAMENSSVSTLPEITPIANTNLTLITNQTTTTASTPTPAITKPASTTTVAMTPSSPVSTPGPKQPTTQARETTVPPKPFVPSTHPGPAPIATSKDNVPMTPTGGSIPQDSTNHVALYLLLPLVVLAGVAMLIMIGSYLRKKIRLDKLRHQLLPLYNFDPQEGEDWETELLTEPRANSQTPLNTTKE
ncbi:uncharacterized protein [Asterias amurensis]|uniref:uncharacterized protein isoform X2 n=1 Tax=Asterias amurensis TaxID=7602 RepID=UPI003AB1CCEA